MNHFKLQDKHDIIYCGHWQTAYGHKKYGSCKDDYGIYYNKGIVVLDGCTALTHHVNIATLEGEN